MEERTEEGKKETEREGRREVCTEGGEGGRAGGREGAASRNPDGMGYSAIKKQGFSSMHAHTSQGISTADSVPS